MKTYRFIDFFSGVGGFTRGLELAGCKCVGHCEFDKFAEASYRSMHCITEEQRKELLTLPLHKRQKEILKPDYLNGEFYEKDIKNCRGGVLPKAEIWTFGAPCQDFSIAGKRRGLEGERSSLIREIFRLLEEREEKDRPKWIIYENVKGMLSSNRGLDFLSILSEMDRLGYDCEWQIVNSRWWIPQNRERVYTVGHLRRYGRRKILPIKGANGKNYLKQLIPGCQGERVYNPKGIGCTLVGMGGGLGAKTGLYAFKNIGVYVTKTEKKHQRSKVFGTDDKIQTLTATDYKEPLKIAIPVLTPDRIKKRQNGRRLKNEGDPSFTLTTQDIHGVAIGIIRPTRSDFGKKIRKKYESGDLKISRHKFLKYEVKKEMISNTISTVEKDNLLAIKIKNCNSYVWAIWSEKYKCHLAIRKLTPRECFRLQGWSDNYFERAEQFNSNSQLYKQAGNGVTVKVVEAIGNKLKGEIL